MLNMIAFPNMRRREKKRTGERRRRQEMTKGESRAKWKEEKEKGRRREGVK